MIDALKLFLTFFGTMEKKYNPSLSYHAERDNPKGSYTLCFPFSSDSATNF